MTRPTLAAALKRGGPIRPSTYSNADRAAFWMLLHMHPQNFKREFFRYGDGWTPVPLLYSQSKDDMYKDYMLGSQCRYWPSD